MIYNTIVYNSIIIGWMVKLVSFNERDDSVVCCEAESSLNSKSERYVRDIVWVLQGDICLLITLIIITEFTR